MRTNEPLWEDSPTSKALKWDDYWAICRRRRWWFLLPLFVCWAAVWGVVWFLPGMYRSETVILVEQQKVPEAYVVPNVSVELQERLQSMTQQILSRTRLLRIIQDFNLYQDELDELTLDELVERMREDIEIELVRAPGRGSDLTAFKIYYSSKDPRTAERVTSQLTSLFIEDNLRARQQESESTTTFLEAQLEDARTRLQAQEEKLREFKARFLGQLPEQLGGNIQILGGLQNRLQQIHSAISSAEQRKVYLESLLGQHRALQGETGSEGEPPLLETVMKELDRLKGELTLLEARYTERHPDVLSLKARIAETEKLKKQLEDELTAALKSAPEAGAAEDEDASKKLTLSQLRSRSFVMQVESELKAVDLEIANRKEEAKEVEGRIDDYQTRLNLTPLREQQLADLTRDYEQTLESYQSLLAKRMQSELATNLEKRQQGEQFRILDPPSLPQKPYSPDRFRLSLLGLLVGAVLGIGVAAGKEVIDDGIHSEKDLKSLIPVSVLGGIPPLWTRRERRWRRVRIAFEWLVGTGMVSLIVAGNILVHLRG